MRDPAGRGSDRTVAAAHDQEIGVGGDGLVERLEQAHAVGGGVEPELAGAGGHEREPLPIRALSVAPMRVVGDWSYSLYLWHWPLLIIPEARLGHELSVRFTIFVVVLTFVLAGLTYRFVETPFRNPVRMPRRRALSLYPAAVGLVVVGPIALLAIGLSQAREYVVDAPQQYRELLDYIARTILELRQKLPPDIAAYLPVAADDVQRMVANYLRTQAGSLALAGRAWLNALLFAYVGLIIGGLAAVTRAPLRRRPQGLVAARRRADRRPSPGWRTRCAAATRR